MTSHPSAGAESALPGPTGLERSVADDFQGATVRLVSPLLGAATLIFCFHLWRLPGVNITFSDLLFALAIFIELSNSRLNGRPFGASTPIWLVGLIVMLTGLFIGSFVNGDLTRWLIVAAQYLFSYMLLPMLLIRDKATLRRLIVILIIAMVAMESLGIAGYYLLDNYDQAAAIFGPGFISGNGRLGALVGDANWNSAVIAMTLPFVIYVGCSRLIGPTAALLSALILLWALTLAASFTGFSAAMFAIATMTAIGRIRPSPKVVILSCALVGCLYLSGYQMPAIFAKRVAPAIQNGSLDSAGTYDDRADLIVEAWNHADKTAVVGMGVDEYRKFSAFGQPVHNMYMLQFSEGGVLALAGWLVIVVTLILIPLSRIRRHRLEASLCLSVITVLLIFTMASPHMYARFWMVPVLFSLGIVLTADQSLPHLGRKLSRNRTGTAARMY